MIEKNYTVAFGSPCGTKRFSVTNHQALFRKPLVLLQQGPTVCPAQSWFLFPSGAPTAGPRRWQSWIWVQACRWLRWSLSLRSFWWTCIISMTSIKNNEREIGNVLADGLVYSSRSYRGISIKVPHGNFKVTLQTIYRSYGQMRNTRYSESELWNINNPCLPCCKPAVAIPSLRMDSVTPAEQHWKLHSRTRPQQTWWETVRTLCDVCPALSQVTWCHQALH